MNTHRRLKLSVAISGIGFCALCNGVLAQQQSSPELDITISVIEADETPAGFVNRLALPSLDSLNSVSAPVISTPALEVAEDIGSDVNEIVDVVTEIGADNIRETISIDGTTNIETNGVINVNAGGISVNALPTNIVDILDPASPLQNTLQDTVDQVSGVLDTTIDAQLDTQIDTIVENIEPATTTGLDSNVQGIVEEPQALPIEEIPTPTNEIPLPLEDISDELREVPLL